MKRSRVLVVGAVMLLTVVVSVYEWRVARLRSFRTYIEAVYSRQFSLIEQRSREFDKKNHDLQSAILDELRAVFSSNEVFYACWSLDRHHVTYTIKPLRESYARSFRLTSVSADNLRSLRYGRSEKGQALLIYEGEIPGGAMRFYTIAFALDAIKKQREKQ